MSESEERRELERLLQAWENNPSEGRDALIEHARERVAKLASKMLRKSYARVGAYEETDDILQEACLRLTRMLEEVRPTSADSFLKLSTTAIRRTLLDLARSHFGPMGMGVNQGLSLDDSNAPSGLGSDASSAPVRLARWTEFHDLVQALPDERRAAFELHWYQGMTIPEISRCMNISERTVNRRLLEAKLTLGEYLADENRDEGFVRRS